MPGALRVVQRVRPMDEVIRKAQIRDVEGIHALVNRFAGAGSMLARSLSELYDDVRDFTVAVAHRGPDPAVVGCCALRVFWKDLAEIRSLAVSEDAQGHGVGRALVVACLDEARALGVPRVFALTYEPDFFAKFGFGRVDREALPHKVWMDCLRCPKYPNCDEVAVAVDL